MRKILSVFLAICLCVPIAFTFIGCKKKTTAMARYTRYNKTENGFEEAADGNYIKFGSYPQSEKEESVTISGNADSNGYFKGSDGEKYEKVDDKYYKVEPLMWRILTLKENNEALIFCETIIDQTIYDDDSSNYAQSVLRSFLNDNFYNKAFNASEKKIIAKINVDNSASKTTKGAEAYACENTDDYVFAMAYKDMYNTDYGYSTWYDDPAKAFLTTDYARAKGVSAAEIDGLEGLGDYWLRSPASSDSAFYGDPDGRVHQARSVYSDGVGIAPALRIKL